MFGAMFGTKNKVERPASAGAAAASFQNEKAAEMPHQATAPARPATAVEAQYARSTPKSSSSLNAHLFFEGNLKFSGTVLIDCDFRGRVVTDDRLVVGASGNLHAEVTAGVVEISGKVRGNIKASNSVKIFSRGEVHGNIETPTIAMQEGVVFEGKCTRPEKRPQQEPVAETPQQAQVNEPECPAKPERPAKREPRTTESARKKTTVSAIGSTKRPRSSGRKRTRARDLALTS